MKVILGMPAYLGIYICKTLDSSAECKQRWSTGPGDGLAAHTNNGVSGQATSKMESSLGPTELVGTSIVFYGLKVIKMKTSFLMFDWLERLFQPQAFTLLCGMRKPPVLAAPLPMGRAKPMKKEQPWTRTARTCPLSGCSRASMTWDMVAFSMAREQDTSSIWAALPISRKGFLSSWMFQVITRASPSTNCGQLVRLAWQRKHQEGRYANWEVTQK